MSVYTAVEIDRDSNPVRVYHRTRTESWTHPMEERSSCSHCNPKSKQSKPRSKRASDLLARLQEATR